MKKYEHALALYPYFGHSTPDHYVLKLSRYVHLNPIFIKAYNP